jgi:hypothetical protein
VNCWIVLEMTIDMAGLCAWVGVLCLGGHGGVDSVGRTHRVGYDTAHKSLKLHQFNVIKCVGEFVFLFQLYY